MKQKSFTLIELLVVIVIIGILAGVIVVSTSSAINKANFAKAQAFSSTVKNELFSDLISEWTFDEDSGSIAKDTAGNNDGTVVNATYKPRADGVCVYGGCYSFDGNDYIDYGNILIPSKVDNRTYSFWANYNAYGGAVFSTGNLTNSKNGFSIFRASSISSNYFSYELDLTPYNFSLNCQIPLNKWSFYVIMITPSNPNISFILYKDGVFQDSQTKALAIGGQHITSFKMGARTSGSPAILSEYFNGSIDEFKAYNATLSSAQIKQNYIAGLDSLLSSGNISEEEYSQRLEMLAKK